MNVNLYWACIVLTFAHFNVQFWEKDIFYNKYDTLSLKKQ